MFAYLLRRLALTVPTFIALMFVTFVAIRLVPGDPVEVRVGERGISPERLAAKVQGDDAERLAGAIKTVLQAAIGAGGSSLRDYRQASGELGYFQHRFAVYDREGDPCPNCDCRQGVQRLVQGGRSTFYCAKRQR